MNRLIVIAAAWISFGLFCAVIWYGILKEAGYEKIARDVLNTSLPTPITITSSPE